MSEAKSETEEVERLAVVMIARRDQLKMAEKITELEKRVRHLEAVLFAHLDHRNSQHRHSKARRIAEDLIKDGFKVETRRKPCKTRRRSK